MKANSDKSHLLLSSESDVDGTKNIHGDIISNSKSEKLRVTIDHKLTFDEHCLKSVIKLVKNLMFRLGFSLLRNQFKKGK